MSSNRDFVDTYNNISSSIEGLIGNKDLTERTNRRYTAGYIMEQLAIKGMLKDTINELNFDKIDWNVNDRCGQKMKDFDGRKATWVYENK